jgi:hypothetical protein
MTRPFFRQLFVSYLTVLMGVVSVLCGVPVPTAWRVLGLRMEERPPDMEVSCEYIKESWTDNKGWPSSLGVGRGVNNLSP